MIENVRKAFSSDIYLGLNDSLVLAASEGKVFSFPARLLVELPRYKIIAFGEQAREVEHAGIGKSRVIEPFNSVEVFDERGAEVFMRSVFRVVLGSGFLLKPRVWFGLPSRATPFMREVWTSALLSAGARDVTLVNSLLAVAAGAGLPYQDSHGYAVGTVSEEGITLGLVAFGHVQYEVWEPIINGESSQTALKNGWQKLLKNIPTEFYGSLQREGVVLSTLDDSLEWSKKFSSALGLAVSTMDQAVVVLGLRALAGERNE